MDSLLETIVYLYRRGYLYLDIYFNISNDIGAPIANWSMQCSTSCGLLLCCEPDLAAAGARCARGRDGNGWHRQRTRALRIHR